MCIIIVKKKGLKVPTDVLQTSSKINPHGLGVVWLDDYSVSYHSSAEYKILNTERPFIAHFRYATVGAINKANTHPFVCGSNTNELLMMNGTIRGLGNKRESDSKVLAKSLGVIPRNLWKKELEQYDCRFVTVNTRNKSYQIYNRKDWHQRDGIWYSKSNVLETNYVAVYGTLKKGYNNYWNYLSGVSSFVGSGTTKDRYPLIIQGLPYLIKKIGVGHNVSVDVFRVTDETLARLDRLEGHPNWYRREQININIKGKKVLAWIYFNIRETIENKTYHKSYIQKPLNNKKIQNTTLFSEHFNFNIFEVDDIEDWDDEFNVANETPMCVACYNDLQFDSFSNYYCNQCNTWYSESDILTKFNY